MLWQCACILALASWHANQIFFWAVLYCHLWSVRLCCIFPHYLMNSTIFRKKLLNIKCAFWFSLQLLSVTFLILRKFQWDVIVNLHRSSRKSTSYFCQIMIKLEFSRQIFQKSSSNKFHQNPSCGSWVVLCGQRDKQTGRHHEPNKRFPQFCERA
jgi:hypothetical protein